MTQVKAEIITIGDEILYGHILDTNSQWLCQELDDIGVKVVHRVTIGDNELDIMQAFEEAWKRSDITLITGGLGPTSDDLTKPCLASFFNCEMEIDEEALKEVTEFFRERGRELLDVNRDQALMPVKAKKLSNKMGTAPGIFFHEEGRVFVAMPGVPFEMKHLMKEHVLPRISELFSLPVIHHRIVKTAGIGESFLADKLKSWEKGLPEHIKLAYLPSLGMVKLRLTAVGNELHQLKNETEKAISQLRTIAGKYIYGFDQDTLEQRVGKTLRERGLTISAAESCTGGYLSHLVTSVPGSSDYFIGSVISYANEVKMEELQVPSEVLEEYGAVSEQVVTYMAENVRKKMGTDIGVSVSGIAGPDGGSEEKPVGTVWICYADNERTTTKLLSLGFRNRETNIRLSALAVLNLIRLRLGPEY